MACRPLAKMLVWSDSHCPFQRPESVEWMLSVLRENRKRLTHVICLGDLFEADAASKWGNEYDHDLLDEYAAGAELLDSIVGLCPKAQKIWLLGNHDHNIQAEQRIDKRLRRAAHWNHSQHRDSFSNWRQIPYGIGRQFCYEAGQVIFKHGRSAQQDLEAVRFRNACGGHAHRLVVGGHTHRPSKPTRDMRTKTIPNNVWWCNTGTLGPLDPSWTNDLDTNEWAPALALIECRLGRACQPAVNWECNLLTPEES